MDAPALKHEIVHILESLDETELQRVLDFAQRMKQVEGTPAELWFSKLGTFGFESSDLEEMAKAIEEGCETIDWESWQ